MFDHPSLFVLSTDHVPGRIVEEQNRHVCSVTELYKLRGLRRTIWVNRPVVTDKAKADARNRCISTHG